MSKTLKRELLAGGFAPPSFFLQLDRARTPATTTTVSQLNNMVDILDSKTPEEMMAQIEAAMNTPAIKKLREPRP